MKVLGIIPARYQSSRLPGKPLAEIHGKSMIQRVYEKASQAIAQVVVATDDERIATEVKSFGGAVVLTSDQHRSGTDRCLEAYQKWSAENGSCDVIVNIQGDEPLLEPAELDLLTSLFEDPDCQVGSLVKAIKTQAELDNRSGCFVTINNQDEALYFSRQLIPFLRDLPYSEWLKHHTFYKHIGLYAYRPQALAKFAALEVSSLEKAEALEQNRWLQNGGKIKLNYSTAKDSLSVDTPEDLEQVRKIIAEIEG